MMTTLGGVAHPDPLPEFICASFGFRRFAEDYGVFTHWSNPNCREPEEKDFQRAVDQVNLTSSPDKDKPMLLLVNCMAFFDPDKCSRHLGTHCVNMKTIAADKRFPAVVQKVSEFLKRMPWSGPPRQKRVMLLFWCRSGNHRSVSTCELIHYCLQRAGFNLTQPDHMARKHWWRKCGNKGPCKNCDPKRLPNTTWEQQNRDALAQAFAVYKEVGGPMVETSTCPLVE